MLFSPHHGDPEQARLMSDLGIKIKAEGQSNILSKCCITLKYYNRRLPHGLDQRQGSFMLAKTYHAVIPRRLAAGLCKTAIPITAGSIVPPPFVEDLSPERYHLPLMTHWPLMSICLMCC